MHNFGLYTCYNGHQIWPECIFDSKLTNKYYSASYPTAWTTSFLFYVFSNRLTPQIFSHNSLHTPLAHSQETPHTNYWPSMDIYNTQFRARHYGVFCELRVYSGFKGRVLSIRGRIRWISNYLRAGSRLCLGRGIPGEEFASTRALCKIVFLSEKLLCHGITRGRICHHFHRWKVVSCHSLDSWACRKMLGRPYLWKFDFCVLAAHGGQRTWLEGHYPQTCRACALLWWFDECRQHPAQGYLLKCSAFIWFEKLDHSKVSENWQKPFVSEQAWTLEPAYNQQTSASPALVTVALD